MVSKLSTYPVYDNLNIYTVYSFENTTLIFNDIVDTILALITYVNNNNITLKDYKMKEQSGLNINNFVFAFENINKDINSKIELYLNYMQYFITMHIKYYNKFTNKVRLMFSELNNDIQLELKNEDVNSIHHKNRKYSVFDNILPENNLVSIINEDTISLASSNNDDIKDDINNEIINNMAPLKKKRGPYKKKLNSNENIDNTEIEE
jgi:hypothetical protein